MSLSGRTELPGRQSLGVRRIDARIGCDGDPAPAPPPGGIDPNPAPARPCETLLRSLASAHPHGEKIRALRTELLLRREALDRGSMVALLSPCAGEGRSMLAAELAIGFAQTGHPTLLVDADLHRPQQHVLFCTDNRQGLAQALELGTDPKLHPVLGLPRLSLLSAGSVESDPLELLSSRRFASMMLEWRQNFEFVILDTAPLGQCSDALAVASLAGRVLALSRAQHTPYKAMQDMLRRLAATRSRILGAVINHH